MVSLMSVMRFLTSQSGKELGSKVWHLIQREGLPPEQVAGDVIGFMDQLEELSDLTGKPLKQVADEAVALFRRENKC